MNINYENNLYPQPRLPKSKEDPVIAKLREEFKKLKQNGKQTT